MFSSVCRLEDLRGRVWKKCRLVEPRYVSIKEISPEKRFAGELKKMIEMRYNLNFSEAYGINPLIHRDVQVKNFSWRLLYNNFSMNEGNRRR